MKEFFFSPLKHNTHNKKHEIVGGVTNVTLRGRSLYLKTYLNLEKGYEVGSIWSGFNEDFRAMLEEKFK